jgi:hypothetical protein
MKKKATFKTEQQRLKEGIIPMFKIYKEGMTTEPITILSKDLNEYNNQEKKRQLKIYLGYTIIELN